MAKGPLVKWRLLHGWVSVTMCRIRERFWVTKLRSLTKKVIQNSNVCKRYLEKPISLPPWDNCSPANLKGWNVRPFRSDRSVLCWSSLLQDEEGWYCQRVHCIIYLYQHPQYTWSCCWTSLVCWISKSAKGVYCQVRMPSDPCKWQWENVRGYREMVVYPQEGSQSCKLRWSSEYNGEV